MRTNDFLVKLVREANPHRTPQNIRRRLTKILEELGEASEAYLSVSSPHNYKNKSWEDYREEAADTLIVLLDVALTVIDNYPSAALLPALIEDAAITVEELYKVHFDVANAVSAADQHLQQGDTMGFHGAIHRGITAASRMCFATLGDEVGDIDETICDIFVKKIEKWNNNLRIYAEADNGYGFNTI